MMHLNQLQFRGLILSDAMQNYFDGYMKAMKPGTASVTFVI